MAVEALLVRGDSYFQLLPAGVSLSSTAKTNVHIPVRDELVGLSSRCQGTGAVKPNSPICCYQIKISPVK